MKPMLINAIISLVPNAQVSISNESDIVWHEPSTAPVTDAEITAEIARLQAEYDAQAYARSRASEYPPIGDQLDALWKGGDEAAAMLAKVQAVKAKYPKEQA